MTSFYTHYFTDHRILCGLPGVIITNNPAGVTCPLCLNVLTMELEMAL